MAGMIDLLRRAFQKVRHPLPARLDTWILTGRELVTGEPLCIAFCGTAVFKEYQRRISFQDGNEEKYVGRFWANVIPLYLKYRFPECGLLIVHLYKSGEANSKHFNVHLKSPVWMPLKLDLKATLESSVRRAWFKNVAKKIADNKFTFEVKSDEASLEDFYRRMYLPLVKNRYGSATIPADYRGLIQRLSTSELVMVKMGDNYVGGCLVDFGEEIPRMLEMGVLDGSPELIKRGVSDAIYFMSIDRVIQKGGVAVSFGNSRGFLNDGPLFHKFLVGATFHNSHYPKAGFLYFQILNRTPGLEQFLIQNPLLISEGGRYYATAFCRVPATPSERVLTILKKCRSENVHPRLALFGNRRLSPRVSDDNGAGMDVLDVIDADLKLGFESAR